MNEPKSKPPQDIVAEIGLDDLYEFLGVASTSSEKEITRGYRKKALKYHPDKNPDNPRASDLFQRLSKAYNILTDAAAKAAYDKWLRAKYAAKKRHEELDVKRRKLKESLEKREEQSQLHSFHDSHDEVIAAKLMQKEINRLREEGFRKMKEQQEWLRQQLHEQISSAEAEPAVDSPPSLKVTWKAKKGDPLNGGYSAKILEDMFSEFGIQDVLVSRKKNGSAVITFHSTTGACGALESGCGLQENPLQMTWIHGEPMPGAGSKTKSRAEPNTNSKTHAEPNTGSKTMSHAELCTGSTNSCAEAKNMPSTVLERGEDYEAITLLRLIQAQKKRTLEAEEAQNEPVNPP